jgi:hypothetical protein
MTSAEFFVIVFCGAFCALVVAFLLTYNFLGLKRGFDMQHAIGFLSGCLILVVAGFALGQLP